MRPHEWTQQRCERGEQEALDLSEAAKECLADTDLSPEARDAYTRARVSAASARRAFATGDLNEGERFIAYAYALVADGHRLKVLPYAIRGRPFDSAPLQDRRDALARLIDNALLALPRASAKDLLEFIENAEATRPEEKRIIQEIAWDDPGGPRIYWRDKWERRPTPFKSFQNRVSRRRKKIAPT